MKKKGNKKMHTPRQKVIHNPIPTSLIFANKMFVCLFVSYEWDKSKKRAQMAS